MKQKLEISDELFQYLLDWGSKEHAILKACREETLTHKDHRKQISVDTGQLLGVLTRLINPEKVLELGTFSGYSSLVFALNSSDNCRITTIDMNENYHAWAEVFWQRANVRHKIEPRLGKALDILPQLPLQAFDLIFIDADKLNLQTYYDYALQLVSERGLIIIDNLLWSGRVVDVAADDKYTQAIKAFNDRLQQDERVSKSLLPVGDGVGLIRVNS